MLSVSSRPVIGSDFSDREAELNKLLGTVTSLPFYLPKSQLALMQHWAKRLGWLPLLTLVDDDGVRFHRVASLKTSAKHRRFDARSPMVDNLLDLCRPDASVDRQT